MVCLGFSKSHVDEFSCLSQSLENRFLEVPSEHWCDIHNLPFSTWTDRVLRTKSQSVSKKGATGS